LKIRSILVSQPEPTIDKSPYIDLAAKTNVKIDFRPFVEVEGVPAKDFRKSKINILDYSAVVFTSRTGVDHYFRISKEMRVDIPEMMKYFCVSESIAFYLQKYIIYRKRKIFFSNGTFSDLMESIIKHKDEKFLVPLSDIHKPEIPDLLKKNKIIFEKAILYRTISSNLADLTCDSYDILVFYSPSGVKALLQNFPNYEQNNTKIASFGPTTAKAVKDAGLRLDIQAPNSNAPSMTMALEQYILKFNKEENKRKN
jgi:uroporphyrinogen-III synthase